MKSFLTLAVLFALVSSVLADDYFYDNGAYVSLGTNASRISRRQPINFGTIGPFPGEVSFRTGTSGWAASPSVGVGYKFDDKNSVSLKGDWAGYSSTRSRNSSGTLFGFVSVDGTSGIAAFSLGTPSSDKTKWDSDVADLELEYKRKLWFDPLGGILGMVGFKYRYQGQDFDASHQGVFFSVTLNEKLKENLYGPYLGVGTTFKPMEGSNLGIGLHAKFGYLFKSASLRAGDLFGSVHRQSDHSNDGTFFTAVGVDLTYALTKNWSLSGSYDFEFIDKSAYTINNTIFALGLPTRIGSSSVYTQNLGLKLNYRF
ncbi:MAG: hypothetical protein ACM3TN_08780 [Alphaproteobacteria bacterium]